MGKRLLVGIIITLLITNIYTLFFANKKTGDRTLLDHHDEYSGENQKMSEIVAEVHGKEIHFKDWMLSLQQNYGKKHLKKLIDQELVKTLAEEKDLQINKKLIAREISYLTAMQGIMSADEIVSQEKQWRKDALFRYELEELLVGDEDIPEAKIRDHYEKYKNQYDFSASLQFSHIIVEDFDKAEKVKRELDEGAAFHLLAQEYSQDEETQSIGGYLGYYTTSSQLIPEKYFEIGKSMKEYTYSEPFATGQGIVILYLHKNLPAIEFTYDEIKAHIKNELALKKLEQSLTTDPLWDQVEIDWIYE